MLRKIRNNDACIPRHTPTAQPVTRGVMKSIWCPPICAAAPMRWRRGNDARTPRTTTARRHQTMTRSRGKEGRGFYFFLTGSRSHSPAKSWIATCLIRRREGRLEQTSQAPTTDRKSRVFVGCSITSAPSLNTQCLLYVGSKSAGADSHSGAARLPVPRCRHGQSSVQSADRPTPQ